ncbi:hypothetical protein WJX72_004362 [[Myrmecia] bisecta]|uniref:Uncharacterized protein n=1 Tax=[Myrmecia] bisecta TaxID=41462 RepID=A0AAW1PAX2_9CHLO
MMWKLALVLVALAVVQADTFTLAYEEAVDVLDLHSETVYLVDKASARPRIVGMVQSYEAQREGAPAFTSLFSSGASQSGWTMWMDDQMDLLESLHSVLFGAPPCNVRMSQLEDYADSFTDAPYSALLAHMAKSRFGPAVLSVYAQQAQADDDVDDDVDQTSDSSAVLAGPTALPGWGTSEAQLQTLRATYALPAFLLDDGQDTSSDASSASELSDVAAAEVQLAVASGIQFPVTASVSGSKSASERMKFPVTASVSGSGSASEQMNLLGEASLFKQGRPEDIDWGFQGDDGCVNWGMVVFVVLSAACCAVWFSLLRSWCRFCRAEKQILAAKEASMQQNPLLAPLMHESIMVEDIKGLQAVEVASEHVPASGVEYVSIAYAPLKSEV